MPNDNSNLLKAGQMAPTVNPAVMGAPGRALAGAGAAVKHVGQQAEGIALKMAKVRNEGDLAQARARMLDTAAAFEKEVVMAQSLPEDQWLGELDKRFDALQEEFNASDIAPAARGELEQQFFAFRHKQQQALTLKAYEQSLDRARSQHIAEIDAAVAAGDKEGVTRASYVPGLPTHQQAELERQGHQRIDDDTLAAEVQADPQGVLDAIAQGVMPSHYSKGDIERWRARAEGSRAQKAGEEAAEIYDLWQERVEIKTEADINRRLDNTENMNDKEKKALKTRILGGEGVSNEEYVDYYDQIRTLANTADQMSHDTYFARHAELMRDLNILGKSEGAEELRRMAGGISPANLKEAAGRGPKSVRDNKRKIALARIDDLRTKREEVAETSKQEAAVAIQTLNTMIDTHPNPEAITDTELDQMADKAWAKALKKPQRARGAGLSRQLDPDALGADFNPDNPLLPKKGQGPGWRPGGI